MFTAATLKNRHLSQYVALQHKLAYDSAMEKISVPFRVCARLPGSDLLYFRGIRPSDRKTLHEQFLQLSTRSVRDRFLTVKRDLTPAELSYFTEVDFIDHVAIVAELATREGLRPAAVGRFVRSQEDPECCEFAITVVDELQGRGIGKAMLKQLIQCARALGIRRFEAEVFSDNRRVTRLLRGTGLPLETITEGGVSHVSMAL